MQGFLLGLSNGTTCLAYCAPVLIPFLLGEGKRTRQNWLLLGQFIVGRLAGYLLFGLLAWSTYELILGYTGHQGLIFGAIYVVLAGMMLFYGIFKAPATCAGSLKGIQGWLRRWPALMPLALGLLTGLNLCPPFLLALTSAASTGSLLGSILFFGTFFLGTLLYFIPLPFVGTLSHIPALRTIGKFTAALVALYYLVSGTMLIIGGLGQL